MAKAFPGRFFKASGSVGFLFPLPHQRNLHAPIPAVPDVGLVPLESYGF